MNQYLLQSTIILTLFFLVYRVFLSKETFFRLNRFYLLLGIASSIFIPLWQIPEDWALLRKNENIEDNLQPPVSEYLVSTMPEILDFSTFKEDEAVDLSNSLPQPVEMSNELDSENDKFTIQPNNNNINSPAYKTEKNQNTIIKFISKIPLYRYLFILYLTGIIVLCLFSVYQIFKLIHYVRKGKLIESGRFKIYESMEYPQSFSFLNLIFIRKESINTLDYQQIVQHEKVHLESLHTLDMIISEIMLILFWFNPITWLYKRSIENNLEFLTDQEMLKQNVNPREYQWSLLHESVSANRLSLVNHYNHSFLKKRIMMMNQKNSSILSVWKYVIIFPLVLGIVLTMNKVKAQEVQQSASVKAEVNAIVSSHIEGTPATSVTKQSGAEIARAEVVNPSAHISAVLPISEGNTQHISTPIVQPAITAEISNVVQAGQVTSEDAIIFWDDLNIGTEGTWKFNRKNGSDCIEFSIARKRGNWNWQTCFEGNELNGIENIEQKPVKITRDAGTITMTGTYSNGSGKGDFSFETSPSFVSFLESSEIEDSDDTELLMCFVSNIGREYITALSRRDFDADLEDILALGIHGIEVEEFENYADGLKAKGIEDLELEDIVALKIHDVDIDFISAIDREGFEDMEMEDYIQFKIHGIDPDYINQLTSAGFSDLETEEVVQFAIHGVEPEFINSIKSSGIEADDAEDIVQLKIHGVSTEFINKLAAQNLEDLDIEDLVALSIHGVDAEYVNKVRSYGLEDLDVEEIIQMKIHGVQADFIKRVSEAGIEDLEVEDLVQLAIHGVSPQYVSSTIQALGDDVDLEEIIQAAIHGVKVDFIQTVHQSGIEDVDMEEIIAFEVQGITGDYIKNITTSGLEDIESEDIISLRIHGVESGLIKDIIALGFEPSVEEIVALKIHGVSPAKIGEVMKRDNEKKSLKEYIKMSVKGDL